MSWIVFNFCYYAVFVVVPIIVFVCFSKDDNFHSSGGVLYFIKYIFGKNAIRKMQKKLRKSNDLNDLASFEESKSITDEILSDRLSFSATDQNGNQLSIKLTLSANYIAEMIICLRIDGKTYILPEKNHSQSSEHPIRTKSIPEYRWKCQGLNIEILEPLKRCRLTFSGMLLNVTPQKYGRVENVKFNFIWNCCSKPNISWLDDDLDLLTRSMAETKWRDGRWLELLGDEKGYVQFGALKGQVFLENSPETELNMSCVRRRNWGILESEALNKRVTVFACTENGYMLDFGVKSIRGGCQTMKFGYVLMKNGFVFPIQNIDLNKNIADSVSDRITIHVRANNKTLKLILTTDKNSSVKFINNNFYGFKCQNTPAESMVETSKGMALLDHWNSFTGEVTEQPPPILRPLKVEQIPDIFVTEIGSEESKILELTGGKGNSLGLMKSLDDQNEITIPDGFVVTTQAFQQQIQNNFHLRRALSLLEDIALGKEKGNLEEACQNTVELFAEQSMTPSVAQAVTDELIKFRRKHDEKIIPFLRWAVRSSAIGEDSDEFSSAGQNETFLGCQTDKDVLRKITKCWGSLFTYQSVTYRRLRALPIRTSMAVVIQKMVPSEAAGVLFTCHPSDSNHGKMVITTNFGLGETVVSGEAEPDTIILSKTLDGDVKIDSYTIGSKSNFMLMSRYGIQKNTIQDERSNCPSLSIDLALKLGRIGILLETVFGSPRDVEWAVLKDRLYILQSRPITTLNQWTDYELLHEFDTAHVSNDTFYTKANIGEVIPFAMTALSQSVMHTLERGYQIRMFGSYDPYVSKTMRFSHHHCMIDLLNGLYARPTKQMDITFKMVDLAVFGHPVLNEDLHRLAIERFGIFTEFAKMKQFAIIFTLVWKAPGEMERMISTMEDLDFKIGRKDTAMDMYEKIIRVMDVYVDLAKTHCLISLISVVYQTLSMITLMEGNKEITTDHYSDLALILSCCKDVVSAEVPSRLEEMADALKKCGLADQFVKLPPDNGVSWLKENCEEVHKRLEKFLQDHGHRVLGELELSTNTWGMNPSNVIEMIQANCRLGKSVKKTLDAQEDIVDQLVSPQKEFTKKILRFLIKKQRVAVGNREKSKSTFVKAVNKLRIAYRTLAKEMVGNGLLPSENLIHHLTQHEILNVIQRKNPYLVSKAIRRQKMYQSWNKLRFPEIMYGIPVPEVENDGNIELGDSEVVCKGTPVCLGDVTARACVLTSLNEIKVLEEGDILITKSTDIGWSPYFPILSGIVTELGGLVSHGAVVAREYGLPCVVGAKDATKIFKTGDRVHLSAKHGTITLISKLQ
ncbi:hypothetical protein HHI36_021421 [Cryptolaemus montrouzieri]|uniref:Phosphoenolpyruvate synthase n=1 Tax=Cryptolaemus montrouzieri TaxID=559131 RepID=A0ABD2MWV8_9CUCU